MSIGYSTVANHTKLISLSACLRTKKSERADGSLGFFDIYFTT